MSVSPVQEQRDLFESCNSWQKQPIGCLLNAKQCQRFQISEDIVSSMENTGTGCSASMKAGLFVPGGQLMEKLSSGAGRRLHEIPTFVSDQESKSRVWLLREGPVLLVSSPTACARKR